MSGDSGGEMRRIVRFLVATAGLLATSLGALYAQEQPVVRPQIDSVSMVIDGRPAEVVTYIYRPEPQNTTQPVIIFSHGNRIPPTALLEPITPKVASWWLQRGFAVVAPVRPGYGPSGGTFREGQNVKWDGSSCTSEPTYQSATLKGSEVVAGALKWVQEQPWAKRDRVILVGYSAGWPGTLVAAARDPEGVVAAINFSGGMGGNPQSSPGHSCKPELLTDIYRQYGTATHIPTLWIYAENDLFWGPEQPKRWFDAFRSGGSDARLVQTGAAGANGHFLIDTDVPLWSPAVAAFLDKLQP
jgi:dienelactone hydrolase